MTIPKPSSIAIACLLLAVLIPQSARGQKATVQVRKTVSGELIVATARQQLGVPYRYGGTTPKAFDCSGLVRFVYAKHGFPLPRTAHEQAGVGIAPYPSDLQPGDLLFFYGGRGAQHIAIYAGNDTLIHASSGAKRVKLDRFTRTQRTWFGRRLIAVRRVLPAERVSTIEVPDGMLDSSITGIPAELTLSLLPLP